MEAERHELVVQSSIVGYQIADKTVPHGKSKEELDFYQSVLKMFPESKQLTVDHRNPVFLEEMHFGTIYENEPPNMAPEDGSLISLIFRYDDTDMTENAELLGSVFIGKRGKNCRFMRDYFQSTYN